MACEIAEWQSRPLEALYPVMFFDALRVKVRDQGTVSNKAVCLALGITPDGRKHILGYGLTRTRALWRRIVNELRNREVKDILIAVVDGPKGFPEAINTAFPQTLVQTCIVHLLCNALAFVSWQDRKQVVAALKPNYQAPSAADAALLALDAFEAGLWVQKYAAIAPLWRQQWENAPKAVTATARKISVLFYNTLRHGMEYSDPEACPYEERYGRRVITNL